MSKILYFIIIILFLVLGLGLGVFNPHKVEVDFVFIQIQLPLSILLALSILLGILITVAYLGSVILKLKWQLKKKIKENTKQSNQAIELNSQLIELKSLSKDSLKRLN